jgi:hypothetical protein
MRIAPHVRGMAEYASLFRPTHRAVADVEDTRSSAAIFLRRLGTLVALML